MDTLDAPRVLLALGTIATIFFGLRLIRGFVHFFDDAKRTFEALSHQLRPNGGRIMSADDAEATVMDVLLDMRHAARETLLALQSHDQHTRRARDEQETAAEARVQRLEELLRQR